VLIGLAYDLASEYHAPVGAPPDAAAEFDDDEVIDAVARGLASGGHEVLRIGNVRRMAEFLSAGNKVDLVFNLAEGVRGRGREAQVPALLEAFDVPYSGSDPATLAICLDKALTKRLWHSAGLPTAPHAVLGGEADLDSLPFDPDREALFVKPVREGSSMGVTERSVSIGREQLRVSVRSLVAAYAQPALVEPFLPGPEFTVGILGEGAAARVLGCLEVLPALSDYRVKKGWGIGTFRPLKERTLESDLGELALRAYRAVECRDFGRIDIRLDASGNPNLLEVNPLPGLRPASSALPIMAMHAGLDYEGLILEMLGEAERRVARDRRAKAPEKEVTR
jgi:D-alanine-D-alanine ligase